MIKHYLTDEVGTILAVYDDTQEGATFAYKQGQVLANAFPDSEIYFHSVYTSGKIEVGMASSMKGANKITNQQYRQTL